MIAVSFNESMDPTTITTATFTVTGPGTTPVTGSVTYDATNNMAIFAPAGTLPVSTTFTGTITIGAKSAAEVPLASNFVWTFVTSADLDTTKPTVISTNPANLAASVATNQQVTATFSEVMDPTTITVSTFTLTGPGLTPVTGTVTYSSVGATATFTPASALAAGVTVYCNDYKRGQGPRRKSVRGRVHMDLHNRFGAGRHRTRSNFHDPC